MKYEGDKRYGKNKKSSTGDTKEYTVCFIADTLRLVVLRTTTEAGMRLHPPSDKKAFRNVKRQLSLLLFTPP